MDYIAKTEIEDGTVLVSFPDCPGCQTEGDDMSDALKQAREALEGWLETHLQEGKLPPRPAFKGKGLVVPVPVALGLKLQLRWARADAGITQSDLAKRLGVTQQMIAKLENPDYEPSMSKVELVAHALGLDFHADLVVHGAKATAKRPAGVFVKTFRPFRSTVGKRSTPARVGARH